MSKHIAWLDTARIIAIFGVILIHVSSSVFGDNRSDIYMIHIANVDFTRSFQPFHKHVSTFSTANQAVKL